MRITALKKTRQEKGFKQNEFARKAKISIRALQNYESGERIPDVHTAQRIASALCVDVKDLFPLPTETSQDGNTQQNFSTNAAEKQSND